MVFWVRKSQMTAQMSQKMLRVIVLWEVSWTIGVMAKELVEDGYELAGSSVMEIEEEIFEGLQVSIKWNIGVNLYVIASTFALSESHTTQLTMELISN